MAGGKLRGKASGPAAVPAVPAHTAWDQIYAAWALTGVGSSLHGEAALISLHKQPHMMRLSGTSAGILLVLWQYLQIL